ncbi:MAG: hypothetical protein J6J16_00250 [Lachnospiraceae bacterium]|nr:hypothetical protein [Lachnospiraceae bacterium]
MSKKIPSDIYEKTFSFRFKRWLDGTKDPFIDVIETKPQTISEEELERKEQYKKEKEERIKNLYTVGGSRRVKRFNKLYTFFCVAFCVFLVAMLLVAVSNLPAYGEATNPANNEVAKRYIEEGLKETGSVNIVTGMILDYRAFDTLGESHVLFIATAAVLILLAKTSDKTEEATGENDRIYEPKNDVILQTAARLLVPPIIIFGAYVVLCGHLGPGGGFSGGAIIGAGLILYLNAFDFKKTERFFTAKTYKVLSISALGCYCLAKSYSFYTGANHIHSIIPLGTAGDILSSGLILILNICVGVVVAGTMYTFYVMFRKGGY